MATAPAPKRDEVVTPAPKKSKKLLIIVLVLLVVVILAAVAVVGLLLMKKGSGDDDAQGKAEAQSSSVVDLSKPPTFIALEPFVVNLAPAEGDRFLQVVLALRVADAKTGENLKGFMPEIRHRINLMLSSKLPSELSTPEGREDLAADIVDEINTVLGSPPGRGKEGAGPVQAVLFNSFIIQ